MFERIKKEKCIIHIGIPKTGSTSLQHAWLADRERLEEQGILYPDFQTDESHWPLMLPFIPEPEKHHLIANRGFSAQEYRKFAKTKLQEFYTQLSESSANTCLLSSEGFFDIEGHQLELFRKFMSRLFTSVTIVVYFRKATSLYPSYLQELLKNGVLIKELPLPQEYRSLAKERIRDFQKVFGEENVVVRSFDREQLIDGNVVTDFYTNFLPLPPQNWERKNESLPGSVAICLSIVTEVFPKILPVGENVGWKFIRQTLMAARWSTKEPFAKLRLPKEWIYFVAKNHGEDLDGLPVCSQEITREEFSSWFYLQVDTEVWQQVVVQLAAQHIRNLIAIQKEN